MERRRRRRGRRDWHCAPAVPGWTPGGPEHSNTQMIYNYYETHVTKHTQIYTYIYMCIYQINTTIYRHTNTRIYTHIDARTHRTYTYTYK